MTLVAFESVLANMKLLSANIRLVEKQQQGGCFYIKWHLEQLPLSIEVAFMHIFIEGPFAQFLELLY